MKLHNLKPALGSVHKKSKRVGRGQGSGKGGTSTRGHNGAKSRSGYSRKIGFEGGQMPLQRRVPKFGFKNINRKSYYILNVSDLQHIYETKSITEINPEVLLDLRIIKKNEQVKILGNGELKVALNIVAHKFSKSSIQIIEKNGGKVTRLLKEEDIDKGTD